TDPPVLSIAQPHPIMRRTLIILVITIFALAARGDDKSREQAIAAGLSNLAQQQNLDGSFELSDQPFTTTGLSLLAFLTTGNTSEGGDHATNVRRAIEFLLREAPDNRDFSAADQTGIAGQAIVTLALCEACGVEPDEATRLHIRTVAQDALKIL